MRVAIPIADGRISPVFDAARRVLLVDLEDGREVNRSDAILDESPVAARAGCLARLQPNVLICGAISRPLEELLLSAGIEVIGQTCGNVEEVLGAFVTGKLTDDAFIMPGCCRHRRRHRGGRCRTGAPSRKRGRGN